MAKVLGGYDNSESSKNSALKEVTVTSSGNKSYLDSNLKNSPTDPISVRENSFISTLNSTGVPLNSGLTFTGEWEDIQQFSVLLVTVKSDVASVTDGLSVQFNEDIVTYPNTPLSSDEFTVSANSGKTFSFQPVAKYFRVVYTNGGSDQTSFRLHTQKKSDYVKPSSHRIQDNIVVVLI